MEELTPLLEELAKKLGTTVEQLWEVILNQVQVQIKICELLQGVAIFVFGGIELSFCVLGIIGLIRQWDWQGVSFSFACTIAFTVIGGIIYVYQYAKILTLKLNPEYWAVQQILNSL